MSQHDPKRLRMAVLCGKTSNSGGYNIPELKNAFRLYFPDDAVPIFRSEIVNALKAVIESDDASSDRRSAETDDRSAATDDRRSAASDRRSAATADRRSAAADRRRAANDRRRADADAMRAAREERIQPVVGCETYPLADYHEGPRVLEGTILKEGGMIERFVQSKM